MIKRIMSVGLILLVMTGAMFAEPTVTAGNGLFRVQNAANMGKGTLGLSLYMAGNPTGAYHFNDAVFSTWDAVIRLGASYVPLNFLEIGLVPAFGYNKPHADSSTSIGLWDLEANVKGSYQRMKVLKLGIQARFLLPLAGEPHIPDGHDNGLDIGLRGLVTADLRDAGKVPVLVHLNGGYLMTGDQMAGDAVTDYLTMGAGLEIPIKYVSILAELYTERPMEEGLPNDLWFTPTVRFHIPPIGLNFEYAMDFLMNQAEDDDREALYRTVTMGLSWSPPEKKHIPMGSIAGMVKDAESNKGLVAKLSFTGPETGVTDIGSMGFELDSLDPGTYTLEVTAQGYEPLKKTLTVLDGKVTRVEFNLKPAMVILSGAVHDRKTDAGLPAMLRFNDAGIGEVKTDPATGLFRVKLNPGTYGLEVISEGYLSQTASVNVGKDGAVKDFKLVKKGMKIAFRGINFETAEAVILAESYPILDEAAQILKENPDVRIEIGGHTDSRGSDSYNQKLSQERAEAVRLYLIENHAIEGNRMIAKGYGETQPVAPNDTEENMFKNRRVEFTILVK